MNNDFLYRNDTLSSSTRTVWAFEQPMKAIRHESVYCSLQVIIEFETAK